MPLAYSRMLARMLGGSTNECSKTHMDAALTLGERDLKAPKRL